MVNSPGLCFLHILTKVFCHSNLSDNFAIDLSDNTSQNIKHHSCRNKLVWVYHTAVAGYLWL